MPIEYNEKNLRRAQDLRHYKNATPEENRLWYDYLNKYLPKFQRQKPIGNYIADFYCHKAKLVIELDGRQHRTQEGRQKDEYRTEKLEIAGLEVIRFSNHQIQNNFHSVCRYIDKVVKERISQ